MWMGGPVPLGYDVEDRKLVINRAEADTVRLIFQRYLDLGSVVAMLNPEGEHVPGAYEAIISDKVWNAAQRLLTDNRAQRISDRNLRHNNLPLDWAEQRAALGFR
jgi:hypothetical protein